MTGDTETCSRLFAGCCVTPSLSHRLKEEVAGPALQDKPRVVVPGASPYFLSPDCHCPYRYEAFQLAFSEHVVAQRVDSLPIGELLTVLNRRWPGSPFSRDEAEAMIVVSSERILHGERLLSFKLLQSLWHFLISRGTGLYSTMCVQLMEANNRVMYADGVVHLI